MGNALTRFSVFRLCGRVYKRSPDCLSGALSVIVTNCPTGIFSVLWLFCNRIRNISRGGDTCSPRTGAGHVVRRQVVHRTQIVLSSRQHVSGKYVISLCYSDKLERSKNCKCEKILGGKVKLNYVAALHQESQGSPHCIEK
jgi:hypothetical protein